MPQTLKEAQEAAEYFEAIVDKFDPAVVSDVPVRTFPGPRRFDRPRFDDNRSRPPEQSAPTPAPAQQTPQNNQHPLFCTRCARSLRGE
jgi:hypothetical protein